MTVYRVDMAYDGSGFRGYAKQPNVRSVQGDFEAALGRIVPNVDTIVAGRTDAGVHADGQVVSFETDHELDRVRVLRSLNKMLNPEIAINELSTVPNGFHARFSAVTRTYRYRIDNGPVVDPQWRWRAWHLAHDLDVAAMGAVAELFLGLHDFASFCRAIEGRSTERTVLSVDWRRTNDRIIEFEICASSFCQQMVRSLVDVCVDVGRGRIPADEVPRILEARDRSTTGGAAPARGLTLWHVGYGEGQSRQPG